MKLNILIASLLLFISFNLFAQDSSEEKEFSIKLLEVNSKSSEIGITFYGKFKVYFASNKVDAKAPIKLLKNINTTFEAPTYDMYEAYISEEGNLVNVEKLKKKTFLNNNESNPTFTSDLKTVFFTQNNIVKGKYIEDKAGNVNMKLFRATVNDEGDWTKVESLPFNGDNFSCAHPALSEDNKILFFSSNKQNPKAASDIYWTIINKDGSFENPEPMSEKINSPYRDNFPFVADNFLYFSSDRPGGLGGLDIYRYDLSDDNAVPENVGAPINSSADDFGIVMDRENKRGYFLSNRRGGYGQDDIYYFKQNITIKPCFQVLKGVVYDSLTKTPIDKANMTLATSNKLELYQFATPKSGIFNSKMKCAENWQLEVNALNYKPKSIEVVYSNFSTFQNLNIYLEPIIKEEPKLETKPQLTIIRNNKEVLNLPNVYFNLDEPTLTFEGKKTVEKAVNILLEHPELYIEFGCHTDTRASFSYNMNLSDKRVNEVLKYMYKLGADPNRINGKGYGETQPVNKCVDGVYCTEAEHMQNRRAEFEVIKK